MPFSSVTLARLQPVRCTHVSAASTRPPNTAYALVMCRRLSLVLLHPPFVGHALLLARCRLVALLPAARLEAELPPPEGERWQDQRAEGQPHEDRPRHVPRETDAIVERLRTLRLHDQHVTPGRHRRQPRAVPR